MHTPSRTTKACGSILFCLLFGLTVAAPAQTTDSSGRRANTSNDILYNQRIDNEKRIEAYNRLNSFNRKDENRPAVAGIYTSEEMLSSEEKKLLQPAAEDKRTHAAFLKQTRTGLFKLLPPASSLSVAADAAATPFLPLTGGGAFYSFTKQRHDMDRWAEIRLVRNSVETGFVGLSLGLICRLGDVPLNDVTVDTPAVAFLKNLTPPQNFERAERQFHIYRTGVWFDGKLYKSSQPIVADMTYVLRSMSYGRVDVLIAFRILRTDEDGSLHVLWKALQTASKLSLAGYKPAETSKSGR